MTGDGAGLPSLATAVAVCAHPDDESFGLGALLAAFAAAGTEVTVLCFTHGEASTLHGVDGDLHKLRAEELAAAAQQLGLARVELLDHRDGTLAAAPPEELADDVIRIARAVDADGLLVFDDGGITGHPDHQAATDAAARAADALDLLVVAWALPRAVTDALNDEFGTTFVGRGDDELDITLEVDRTAQLAAIACHASQSIDNPVLRRRLVRQGDREWLRVLRQPRRSG